MEYYELTGQGGAASRLWKSSVPANKEGTLTWGVHQNPQGEYAFLPLDGGSHGEPKDYQDPDGFKDAGHICVNWLWLLEEKAEHHGDTNFLGEVPWEDRFPFIANYAHAYAEPGCDDPQANLILLGNWNHDRKMPGGNPDDPEEEMTLANWLEQQGCDIEWEDEWVLCEECQKLFRSQPDSYGWTMAGYRGDNGDLCHECLCWDYITDDFMGNPRKAVLPQWGIDLEEEGFLLLRSDWESGWYPGQNDNPVAIKDELEGWGITRFVFSVNSVSQFDTAFSVWVEKTELEQQGIDVTALENEEPDGADRWNYFREEMEARTEDNKRSPDGKSNQGGKIT